MKIFVLQPFPTIKGSIIELKSKYTKLQSQASITEFTNFNFLINQKPSFLISKIGHISITMQMCKKGMCESK